MSTGMSGLTPELKGKMLQVEEQLQLAMQEYPQRIAVERVRFALALAKFVRSQLDVEATVEQSLPPGLNLGRSPHL
jgi:hypothetical protein